MKYLLKLYLSLLLFLFTVSCAKQNSEKIRVACIGDSVTYGLGIEDRDIDSYPAQLLKTSDGKPLRLFEVAGEDEIYKQAKTRIIENKIEV